MDAKEFISTIDEQEGNKCWSEDDELLAMYMEMYAKIKVAEALIKLNKVTE